MASHTLRHGALRVRFLPFRIAKRFLRTLPLFSVYRWAGIPLPTEFKLTSVPFFRRSRPLRLLTALGASCIPLHQEEANLFLTSRNFGVLQPRSLARTITIERFKTLCKYFFKDFLHIFPESVFNPIISRFFNYRKCLIFIIFVGFRKICFQKCHRIFHSTR